MTPAASPATDEMGDTLWRRPLRPSTFWYYESAGRRAGESTEPRTVAKRTPSRIFELEGSHGRHAVVDPEVRDAACL
jgi:hypothetical protein